MEQTRMAGIVGYWSYQIPKRINKAPGVGNRSQVGLVKNRAGKKNEWQCGISATLTLPLLLNHCFFQKPNQNAHWADFWFLEFLIFSKNFFPHKMVKSVRPSRARPCTVYKRGIMTYAFRDRKSFIRKFTSNVRVFWRKILNIEYFF